VRHLAGDISWPWLRAGAAAAPRAMGPMRALVAKELRLQSMTFLVAGFGLAVGLIAWRAELSGPGLRGLWVFPVFTIAIASVAGVAGAIACAGERQLGVLPSQHLLPIRSGREWSIKVATTFGVVAALCAVLLVAFVSFDGRVAFVRDVTQRVGRFRVPDAEGVFLAVAATTVALWVSSWASNAVSAVALTLVAAPVVAGIAETTLRTAQRIALEVVPGLSHAEYVAIFDDRARLPSWMPSMATLAEALIAATFIGLTLTFASRNFRASERDPGRLALQVVVVAAIVGVMDLARSALHIRGYL
jgi:hypothetical protein